MLTFLFVTVILFLQNCGVQSDEVFTGAHKAAHTAALTNNSTAVPSATSSSAPTDLPTGTPTPRPTFRPTRIPTREPTASVPTIAYGPTNGEGKYLFAVLGADACAENLYFGSQAITEQGSADGLHPNFFSTHTPAKNVPHRYWLQVVTSDGVNEIFRIYWTFELTKTLRDRFISTAQSLYSELVQYTVVVKETGQEFEYTAYWFFSTTSGISYNTFDEGVTSCCFSANAGAWGAGSGIVSGDLVYGTSSTYTDFWGVGNFDGVDSGYCSLVFRNGMPTSLGPAMKTYMYYSSVELVEPSVAPSFPPTVAPLLNFKFYVKQVLAISCQTVGYLFPFLILNLCFAFICEQAMVGIDYATYLTIAEDFDALFAHTLEQTVLGVVPGDVQDVTVTETIVSRRLSISSTVIALYRHGTLETEAVEVSYAICNYDADASLSNIIRNLEYTIVNRLFDAAIRQNAAMSGVAEMANLLSATLDITVPSEYQSTDDDGTDDGSGQEAAGGNLLSGIFTRTVLIGIGVGAGGFLVLIAFSCVIAHYSRADGELCAV